MKPNAPSWAAFSRAICLPSEVFTFGSRVHGRNLKPFSDIDLCLRGDKSVAAEVLAKLGNELEDSMLPFKVDVVDWASLSPEFREAIVADLEPLVHR